MPLDVLLLEVAGYFCLQQDGVVAVLENADVFLLLLLALIEQPLACLSQVVVVERECSSAFLAGEVSAEAIIELVDVCLADVWVIAGRGGSEGECVEDDF